MKHDAKKKLFTMTETEWYAERGLMLERGRKEGREEIINKFKFLFEIVEPHDNDGSYYD